MMAQNNLFVQLLNALCDFLLYLAAGGMAVLIAVYLYEIAARFFFFSPTTWANELVAIVLSISVFFAMPKVAAEGGHVAISLLQEALVL
jgi:TRAP-type C4-dicarboxylate transport system permease small subunit